MKNKVLIYSAIGAAAIIAGFLIRVNVESSSGTSWTAKWAANHPNARNSVTGNAQVPFLIYLISH